MSELANSSLILVVEDDPNILDALTFLLEDEGYDVQRASNGKSALDWLETHRPALILLDLMMQGVNGWQFTTIMRQRQSLKTIPIVIISASQRLEQTAHELGVAGYIAKPFQFDDILSIVTRYATPAEPRVPVIP